MSTEKEESPSESPQLVESISANFSKGPSFQISVSEPIKKSGDGLFSYWQYKITTKTNHPDYNSNTVYIVFRRFSEFEWFQKSLEGTYFGCIIPPIPEKDLVGSLDKVVGEQIDLNTKSLLEFRIRGLTKFLTRITEHPILQSSGLLKTFLTDPSNDAMKSVQVKFQLGAGISNYFSSIFSGSKAPEDEFLQKTKKTADILKDVLTDLRSRMSTFVKHKKELSLSYGEFAKVTNHLSSTNEEMKTVAECSQACRQVSTTLWAKADAFNVAVVEMFTFYLGMVSSIDKQIENLGLLKKEQPGYYDQAYKTFQSDYAKFSLERQLDMIQLLEQMKEIEIACNQDVKDVLESAMPSVH